MGFIPFANRSSKNFREIFLYPVHLTSDGDKRIFLAFCYKNQGILRYNSINDWKILYYKHGIAEGEKAIALPDRFFIGFHDLILSCKGAD